MLPGHVLTLDPNAFSTSMTSPTVTAKEAPQRHPEFYFEDGNIILLVENHLYNLHRGVLARYSAAFHGMLEMPKGESSSQEGMRDDQPVILPSTKTKDFEALMWVLYPKVWGEIGELSVEGFLSVLTAARHWDFQGPAELAIRRLDKLVKDPWERVRISQEWNLRSDWLLDSYTAICEQRDPFTAEGVKLIMGGTMTDDSLTRVAKVFQLKLARRTRHYTHSEFRAEVAEELNLEVPLP